MTMFGTKGVKTEERSNNGGSKYLSHGIVKAKINSMVVQKAKNTESRRVVFYLESEPVQDANFKGADGAKGRVGRMMTSYMASDKAYTDFMRQIGTIADKLGVRSFVDSIQANNIDDFIPQVAALFTGKYLWWNIKAEEWDEKKINLMLMRYNFVKSLNEIEESTLKYDGYVAVEARNAAGIVVLSFDKNSKFHFEPYTKPDESYTHGAAQMFQVPTPPVIDLPEAKKAFSVEDLPFSDGAQKTDDLPF